MQKYKILRNFSILTLTNLIIQVLSVLSSIRLARELNPSGYGMFNLLTVQASIFCILAVYGLRIVIIRHIARKREDAKKIFKLSNNIRFITTVIAIVLAVVYNTFQPETKFTTLLLLALTSLIIFQTFWDTIESVSFGCEKMEATGVINLIFTLIWVCEVYLLPKSIFTVQVLAYAYVINQGLKTIIFYWWVNKTILNNQIVDSSLTFQDHKVLILQSNYYFILALFTALQNQIPVLFLQINSSLDQIGIFNLGYKILSPLQMVFNTLLTALFPLFSRLAIENPDLFSKRVKILLNIIVFVGVWACISFALFSKDLVRLLYGNEYIDSANVILIQSWYTFLYAIFSLMGTVLSSLDKQKQLAILSIISGLIGLPIFYYSTHYGAIGLAWGFVSAALLNTTYSWIYFIRILQKKISYTYSIIVFGSIVLFIWLSSFFQLDFTILNRIFFFIVYTIIIAIYLIKIEYRKIRIEEK